MKGLVSIIVPIYNVAQYLEECLNSVLMQTYANWECILIDDGSTDNSSEICREFTSRDTRFKYFYKQNGGLSSARNEGLRKAKGDFITFLDSDDWWGSMNLLEEIFKLWQNNESVQIIQFTTREYLEDLTLFSDNTPEKEQLFKGTEEILKAYCCGKIDVVVWDKIYKREVVNKATTFKEGVYYEDERYLFDLLPMIDSILVTQIGAYNYRIRKGSTTHSAHTLKHDKDFFEKLLHGAQVTRNYKYIETTYLYYYYTALRYYKRIDKKYGDVELKEYDKSLCEVSPTIYQILFRSPEYGLLARIMALSVKFFGLKVIRLFNTLSSQSDS